MSDGRPPLVLEPISDTHRGDAFDCGRDENTFLTEYLRVGLALRDARLDRMRTYVLVEAGSVPPGTGAIAGYFSLEASRMGTPDVPAAAWTAGFGVPHDVPVVYLGMVARDLRYKGQGVGDPLMAGVFDVSVHVADLIGAAGIFLVAVSLRAWKLYRAWGFLDLDGDEYFGANRMFLPMQDARLALQVAGSP